MRQVAFVSWAMLAGCSPFGGAGAFSCEVDEQCAGGPGVGRCESAAGFCSFPDASCGSGMRYGTSSGSLSSVCVGEEPPIDAATDGRLDGPIDGAIDSVSLSCPSSYVLAHGTSKYRLGTLAAAKSYADASADCASDGQRLAVIESAAENTFVIDSLRTADTTNDWSWIGLTRQGAGYVWVTGALLQPADFQNFSSMINNNTNCFNLNDYSGQWGDYYCAMVKRWVCECAPP